MVHETRHGPHLTLLQDAEANESYQPMAPPDDWPDYSQEQIHDHLRLCKQAGDLRLRRLHTANPLAAV